MGGLNVAMNYLVEQGLRGEGVVHREVTPEHITLHCAGHHYTFNKAGTLVAVDED